MSIRSLFAAIAVAMALLAPGLRAQSPARCDEACNHEHPRHFECEGELSATPVMSPKGRALVHVISGGARPDGPWFLLPSGFSPYAGITGPLAPYSALSGGSLEADRPAVSGVPTHANVTRFWHGPPSYTIVLPSGASLSQPVSASFTNIPTTTYTWGMWVATVQGAFFAYTSDPTSHADAEYAGTTSNTYATGGASLPFGTFIWPTTATPLAGPTGNGVNEVILTSEFYTGPLSGGLTSMLVDPSSGEIIECDIIIDAADLIQPAPGGGVTNPREFTALRHEIGHFFGLTHTNLHPGIAFTALSATPYASTALAPTPTQASYPAAYGTTPYSAATMMAPQPIPAMVGLITHMGSGYDDGAADQWPLHADDRAGLARLYPVYVPSETKVPLINVSARIIGQQVVESPSVAAGNGVFARNLWASFMPGYAPGGGAPPPTGNFPLGGAISGMARLDVTDGHLFGLHASNASHPIGPHSFFPYETSVVGNSSNLCSGDFSIDGLPAGSFFSSDEALLPQSLLVVSEDLNFLHPGFGVGNFGEWMDGTQYLNPATAANAASLVLQNQTGNSRPGSAFRVVPGTVIALDSFDLQERVRPGAGAPAVNGNETYIRPLVQILPRDGRGSWPNMLIRARTLNGFPVDPSTARLFINEVDVTASLFGRGLAAFHEQVTNANGTFHRWLIPMNELVTLAGTIPLSYAPADAIRVQFLVQHDANQVGAGPPYVTYGRNDCWL